MKIKFVGTNIVKAVLKTMLFVLLGLGVYLGLYKLFNEPISKESFTLTLLGATIFLHFVEQEKDTDAK